MADDQNLSAQDMQDLREIATHLPAGHPMQAKLNVLLNSQPTQFEQERPGSGNLLEGSGSAAWEGLKGLGKGIVSSLDPTKGLSGAGLSALGVNPRSGGVKERLNEVPIVRALQEQKSAEQDPNSGVLDKLAAGPGALVGMSDESARGHAARGESGAILGEAAVPTALALSPYATKLAGKVSGPLKNAAGFVGRNEFNELRPSVKLGSRVAGTVAGHSLGLTGFGEFGGAYFGPEIADALIPDRAGAFSKAERRAIPMGKNPNLNINRGLVADQAEAARQATAPPQGPNVQQWHGPLPQDAFDEVYGPQQNISTDPYAPPSGPQDLISRTRRLVVPGEEPSPADLKRAGDLTQAPLPRLQQLAKFGDKLAQNEINRRLRNQ